MKKFFFLSYLVFFVLPNLTFSKVEIVKDSKGTDFWFTFLPNYHNNWDHMDPRRRYGDSLYIFIATSEPTKGTIEYVDRQGQVFFTNFEITDPSQMYIFRIPSYNFALLGYNESSFLLDQSNASVQTERVATNAFHITSDKEISVYGLSQANTTSDAFLVLPTDVLGNRYFILSYNSDGIRSGNILDGQSTPSEFAIVAVEDNTNVTIYPKAETYRFGIQTQKINLNKGEVYLVQARISTQNLNSDLTGTEIISSKPIAVFAGHQRATIPYTTRFSTPNPSRDILIEQLPPVSTWGKNSIVVPFAKSRNEIPSGESIYRVLAAEDETVITVNGVRVATLSQGGFYEGTLDRPYYISSNKPILVGAYKKTCGTGPSYLGDPFFAIMPPMEQYLDEYRVLNAQASEIDIPKVYQEQYISVIIPKVSWQSFRIDGSTLSLSDIIDVPGSQHVYANIRVSDGVHFLKADTSFGIVVYGYGNANSYGYIGGSNFLRLNFLEPQITSLPNDSCFIGKGIAYKRRAQDAPLAQFNLVDSLTFNCELYSFLNKRDTIFFGFRLKDIYQDGRYAVYVSDTMNLYSQVLEEWIPGFTFAIKNQTPGQIQLVKGETSTGKDFCFDVPIVNNGFIQKRIVGIYLKNSKKFPNSFVPTDIPPGGEIVFNFCVTSTEETTLFDTLVIENSCFGREILAIEITFVSDKQPPEITSKVDSCNKFIEIIVTDDQSIDKGLKQVTIEEYTNCHANIFTNYPKDVKIQVNIINFREDAFISVIAIDSSGNKKEYFLTIPGFTLRVENDPDLPISLGKHFLGSFYCDFFYIYNYGNFTQVIDKAYFIQNNTFSVLPSNFPIIIQPKTTFPLAFCFNPTSTGIDRDTLILESNYHCVRWEFAFVAEGQEILLESRSKCNVTVTGKLTTLVNRTNRSVLYPNPSNNVLYVQLSNTLPTPIDISIKDLLGREVYSSKSILKNNIVLEINISDLPQGIYFFTVTDRFGNVEVIIFEKI